MNFDPERAKQKLDVASILEDIRSGASDSTLMAKYTLSRTGLHCLFKKLEASGLMRLLNPALLLQDIREGATREDLMTKYRLSARGIQDLFKQLREAGIKFPDNGNGKTHSPRRINVSDMVRDIKSGMDRQSLITKYEISNKQLRKIFNRLERSGMIAKEYIDALPLLEEDTTSVWQPREFLRCYPLVSLHVADTENPQSRGTVVDLSEKGLGLLGITTSVDETKTMKLIPTIIVGDISLQFTARCRWTGPFDPELRARSGFEITEIDEINLQWLRELIGTTTVCI